MDQSADIRDLYIENVEESEKLTVLMVKERKLIRYQLNIESYQIHFVNVFKEGKELKADLHIETKDGDSFNFAM